MSLLTKDSIEKDDKEALGFEWAIGIFGLEGTAYVDALFEFVKDAIEIEFGTTFEETLSFSLIDVRLYKLFKKVDWVIV